MARLSIKQRIRLDNDHCEAVAPLKKQLRSILDKEPGTSLLDAVELATSDPVHQHFLYQIFISEFARRNHIIDRKPLLPDYFLLRRRAIANGFPNIWGHFS